MQKDEIELDCREGLPAEYEASLSVILTHLPFPLQGYPYPETQ